MLNRKCSRKKFESARRQRKNLTHAELKLWKYLRRKQLGYKFRRKSVILGFIFDFYCPKKKLIIEIGNNKIFDKKVEIIFRKYGIKILRFSDSIIIDDIEKSLNEIENLLG